MTDDSSFRQSSANEKPQQLFRRGATCDTYLTRYYGKLVFMKQLKPSLASDIRYRTLFQKEFETGFQLDHPAFARYIEYGEHDGVPYILEEHVDGDTLTDFLKANPNYFHDRRHAYSFVSQLLSALRYLHAHQILFLDLKPDNIIITRVNHDVRLVDFGFAYTSGYPETAGQTEAFAAPEQLTKEGMVDERTDIWLFGKLLDYVAVPPIYNKVKQRCLQPDPDHRYASIGEVMKSLPANPASLHKRLAVIAFVSLLAVIACFLYLVFPNSNNGTGTAKTHLADTTTVMPNAQNDSSAVKSPMPTSAQPLSVEQSSSPSQPQSKQAEQWNSMISELHNLMDIAYNRHLAVLRDSAFDSDTWSAHWGPYCDETEQIKATIIRRYPSISPVDIREEYGRYMSEHVIPLYDNLLPPR